MRGISTTETLGGAPSPSRAREAGADNGDNSSLLPHPFARALRVGDFRALIRTHEKTLKEINHLAFSVLAREQGGTDPCPMISTFAPRRRKLATVQS
jgi:hypothetical protein